MIIYVTYTITFTATHLISSLFTIIFLNSIDCDVPEH